MESVSQETGRSVRRGGGFQSRMAEWTTWHLVTSAGCLSEKQNCVSTPGHQCHFVRGSVSFFQQPLMDFKSLLGLSINQIKQINCLRSQLSAETQKNGSETSDQKRKGRLQSLKRNK